MDFKGGFTEGHIKEEFESFSLAAFLENLVVPDVYASRAVSPSLNSVLLFRTRQVLRRVID